jgi:hypothetical protein
MPPIFTPVTDRLAVTRPSAPLRDDAYGASRPGALSYSATGTGTSK